MVHSVNLHPKAAKELQGLDEPLTSRIRESMLELRYSPTQVGKQLRDSKYWSLRRACDYRVIYQISGEASNVIVLFIGHRSVVYDDFSQAV